MSVKGSTKRVLLAWWLIPLLLLTSMANQPPTAATAEMLSQTAAVAADDTMVARFRLDGLDLATLSAEVTVFPALAPGSTDTEPLGRPLATFTPSPIGGLLVEPTGVVTVRLRVRDDERDGVRLPLFGVYPVVISFSDDRHATAQILTTVIRLADATLPAANPISVAVAVEAGVTLSDPELNELVSRAGGLPLTIVLKDPSSTAPALAATFGGHPIVVGTTPPLDPSALATVGLNDLYRGATGAAVAEAEAAGFIVEHSAVVVDEPLTADGAELLASQGFTTALLTEARSAASAPWPSSTGRLATTTDGMLVVRAEPSWPAEVLQGQGSVALRVQRLISLIVLDEASSGGVVIAGLRDLDNPVATLDLLLRTFAANPLFRLASLTRDDFGRTLGLPELEPAPASRQDLSQLTDQLDQIEGQLITYTSFHLDGPRAPGDYRRSLRDAFDVDLATTSRSIQITELSANLEADLDVITIPGSQSVTLAARTAPLPIAVENTAAGSRRVLIRLNSDKLTIVDPDKIITVPPGPSVIELDVETRSLGASPVSVTILTPDGTRNLASTRFQVRSTAIPGLGLLLSAIGLGLLGTWWYLSIRRNRAAHPSRAEQARTKSSIDLRADDGDPGQTKRGAVTAGDSV